MKARECPYCHESISIKESSRYVLRGNNPYVQCDHCHKRVRLQREPIPTVVMGMAGGFILPWPMWFFVYIMHLNFLMSLLCTLPIIVLVYIALMAIALKRMKFAKEEDT